MFAAKSIHAAVSLILVLLLGVFVVLPANPAGAVGVPVESGPETGSMFNACVRNDTDKKIFYYRKWCSPAGECEQYKLVRISPREEFEHSSDNWENIIFRYQSGGEYGKWHEYEVTGTPGFCLDEAASVFVMNERGYLRLEPAPAKIKELSLAGKDVRRKVQNSINAPEDNAEIFESIEIDILNNLHQAGIPLFTPAPRRNNSTADYKVALNLGIAVADAISAVVMRDKEIFKRYAKIIYDYGSILDVGDTILGRYNSITKDVSSDEWANVESSLYKLKDEITEDLFAGDMRDSAALAMISGWLEGLYVVAKSLDQEFYAGAGVFLRDREFVGYLNEHLKNVQAEMRDNLDVKTLLAVLPEIDKVINRPESYKYTKDDVKAIIAIYEPLRAIFVE